MKSLSRLLFLITCLLIFGCSDTRVDNNVRVLVRGQIFNQNNNSIENATIKVSTDANSSGALPVLLGESTSDALGNFEITSLFGSNEIFYIEITYLNDYSVYKYQTNTLEYRPDDLVFDLGEVILKKLSTFNYSILRESTQGNILDFTFTYTNPFCNEVFENGVIDINNSFCFNQEFISRTLNDDFPEITNRNLIVGIDDTVTFTYSINGGTEQQEVLIINSEDYEFEFTY